MKSSINKLNLEVTYKCNGKHVAIVPNNLDAHRKITEVLKSESAEFHTYARKCDIKPKIILEGLAVLPVEVVTNELQSHNIEVISIYMLRNINNTNLNLATYLVTIDNLTVSKEILKIGYISNIVIKWEKFIKKTKNYPVF